ncbi:hypothetical protein FBZ89_106222 [Nitrospirillum amazonense]|uniref:Uncharacterized protein n=1 Tax=Nitrospirillum amazonense TaxID=28077 RepID=A0A560FGU9_9PROT|nr:hypothetical protein FBZ89_106222 [Nitrospirillum amazonense]
MVEIADRIKHPCQERHWMLGGHQGWRVATVTVGTPTRTWLMV